MSAAASPQYDTVYKTETLKMYDSFFYIVCIVIDVVIIKRTTYVESTLQENSPTVFMLDMCKLFIIDLSPCCQVYHVCICIVYVLVWRLAHFVFLRSVVSISAR
jgi:hypothetical protein